MSKVALAGTMNAWVTILRTYSADGGSMPAQSLEILARQIEQEARKLCPDLVNLAPLKGA